MCVCVKRLSLSLISVRATSLGDDKMSPPYLSSTCHAHFSPNEGGHSENETPMISIVPLPFLIFLYPFQLVVMEHGSTQVNDGKVFKTCPAYFFPMWNTKVIQKRLWIYCYKTNKADSFVATRVFYH